MDTKDLVGYDTGGIQSIDALFNRRAKALTYCRRNGQAVEHIHKGLPHFQARPPFAFVIEAVHCERNSIASVRAVIE